MTEMVARDLIEQAAAPGRCREQLEARSAGDLPSDQLRPAFAYLALPASLPARGEQRARRELVEYARLEGFDLDSLFVDTMGESPYGFAALREVLRRRPDVRVVVMPDLRHVAHVPAVAHLSRAGLGRFLGAAVFLAAPNAASFPASPSDGWTAAAPTAAPLLRRSVSTARA